MGVEKDSMGRNTRTGTHQASIWPEGLWPASGWPRLEERRTPGTHDHPLSITLWRHSRSAVDQVVAALGPPGGWGFQRPDLMPQRINPSSTMADMLMESSLGKLT